MSGSNVFSIQLRERLAVADAARADRLQSNECMMRDRAIQAERFGRVASDLHRTVVRPMVEQLAPRPIGSRPGCGCSLASAMTIAAGGH